MASQEMPKKLMELQQAMQMETAEIKKIEQEY